MANLKLSANLFDQFRSDYQSGMQVNHICQKYEVGPTTVYNYLKKGRVSTRGPRRKHDFDKGFFCEQTTESAYHGGFGFADGCLSSRWKNTSWYYTITIKKQDKEVLDHLRECLGLTSNAIKLRKISGCNVATLVIHGNHLKEDLKKWGIIKRKTYNYTQPYVEEKVLPHFLRGWFDGDGTVDVKRTTLRVDCFHKEGVEWYRKALNQLGYMGTTSIYKVPTNYRIAITGKDNVREFCRVLDYTSFCLQRKLPRIAGAVL